VLPVVSGGGQATLAEYEFLSADMLMLAGHEMLGGATSKIFISYKYTEPVHMKIKSCLAVIQCRYSLDKQYRYVFYENPR
jgi:hypothetical protein